MKNDNILDEVISLFSEFTDVEEITEDCEIMADLGISSMEVLSLVCNMELEFDIEIPEKSIRKMVTIGNVADEIAKLKKSKK